MFKSKRLSLITIFALLLPSSAGLATIGNSAANAASSHTALTSSTVTGVATTSGSTVSLPAGSTTADVVATAGAGATATVTGNTGLHLGTNAVSIVVDAAWTEDVTNPDYVAAHDVTNPDYVAAHDEPNPNWISVEATPNEPEFVTVPEVGTPTITVPVVGTPTITVPVVGTPTISVAAVGSVTISQSFTDTETFGLTLNVLAFDSSLATFTVDGTPVVDGSSVDLAPYTTSVAVVAIAADLVNTNVVFTGGTGLDLGQNTLTAVVSAADGTSTTYTVTLVVPVSDNAAAVISVNSEELINGETKEVD